jgi:hypothetical protein
VLLYKQRRCDEPIPRLRRSTRLLNPCTIISEVNSKLERGRGPNQEKLKKINDDSDDYFDDNIVLLVMVIMKKCKRKYKETITHSWN